MTRKLLSIVCFSACQLAMHNALAATFYVRPGGSDTFCTGTLNVDAPTSGADHFCAFRTLAACNGSIATPFAPSGYHGVAGGDTCSVSGGSYNNQPIIPKSTNFSSPTSYIEYLCAGQDCEIRNTGAASVLLELRSPAMSYVKIDGFIFKDGAVNGWGNGSKGNLIQNVQILDTDNALPLGYFEGDGGGDLNNPSPAKGNTLTNFFVKVPLVQGQDAFRINSNQAGNYTVLRNGTVIGGDNGVGIKSCTNCTLDGVRERGLRSVDGAARLAVVG